MLGWPGLRSRSTPPPGAEGHNGDSIFTFFLPVLPECLQVSPNPDFSKRGSHPHLHTWTPAPLLAHRSEASPSPFPPLFNHFHSDLSFPVNAACSLGPLLALTTSPQLSGSRVPGTPTTSSQPPLSPKKSRHFAPKCLDRLLSCLLLHDQVSPELLKATTVLLPDMSFPSSKPHHNPTNRTPH